MTFISMNRSGALLRAKINGHYWAAKLEWQVERLKWDMGLDMPAVAPGRSAGASP